MAAKNGSDSVTPEVTKAIDTIVRQTVQDMSLRWNVAQPRIVEDIPITIDDVPRHLRMDFKALKVIQQKTGRIMWNSQAWDTDTLDPETMVTIIWACLLHESPDLTPEEVEAMPGMVLSNFTYITDRLAMVWGVASPRPDATDKDADKTAEAEDKQDGDTDPNPPQVARSSG